MRKKLLPRKDERRHNLPMYQIWVDMRRRCLNPERPEYQYYGARGISVCARWASFERFCADMGPRPSPRHSLDRINVNGNYEPGNCRWATEREQQRNRTNAKLTLDRAIEIVGLVRESNLSLDKIGERFGICRTMVRKINLGRAWPEARHLWAARTPANTIENQLLAAAPSIEGDG